MTKEDWDKVKNKWELPYHTIKMECDGYQLTIQSFIYKGRLVRSVYVDGWIKGEWLNENNEIGKRFYRVSESYLHSAKERNETLKQLGKKLYKRFDMDRKLRCVHSEWALVSSFKRHIIANNQEIKYIAN